MKKNTSKKKTSNKKQTDSKSKELNNKKKIKIDNDKEEEIKEAFSLFDLDNDGNIGFLNLFFFLFYNFFFLRCK